MRRTHSSLLLSYLFILFNKLYTTSEFVATRSPRDRLRAITATASKVLHTNCKIEVRAGHGLAWSRPTHTPLAALGAHIRRHKSATFRALSTWLHKEPVAPSGPGERKRGLVAPLRTGDF